MAVYTNGSNAAVRMESAAFDHDFQDCQVDFFGDGALDLVGCEGVVFRNGSIEAPINVGSLTPYVRARAARNCHLRNVWFEEPGLPVVVTQSPWFVDLESGSDGWTISGCHFIRKTGVGGVLRAVRVGSEAGPCHGVTIINPYIRRDSTAAPMPGHIEIANSGSECLVFGGGVETGFGASRVQYPLDVADVSTKSGWIGHRRWRPPTSNTSAVGAVTTNRHLGDILVREGIGVQAYSARARVPSSDNAWLPLSVNRVSNEAALSALALSSKESGTIVWVDAPDPGKSPLRVWNGIAILPAWKELPVT